MIAVLLISALALLTGFAAATLICLVGLAVTSTGYVGRHR